MFTTCPILQYPPWGLLPSVYMSTEGEERGCSSYRLAWPRFPGRYMQKSVTVCVSIPAIMIDSTMQMKKSFLFGVIVLPSKILYCYTVPLVMGYNTCLDGEFLFQILLQDCLSQNRTLCIWDVLFQIFR